MARRINPLSAGRPLLCRGLGRRQTRGWEKADWQALLETAPGVFALFYLEAFLFTHIHTSKLHVRVLYASAQLKTRARPAQLQKNQTKMTENSIWPKIKIGWNSLLIPGVYCKIASPQGVQGDAADSTKECLFRSTPQLDSYSLGTLLRIAAINCYHPFLTWSSEEESKISSAAGHLPVLRCTRTVMANG